MISIPDLMFALGSCLSISNLQWIAVFTNETVQRNFDLKGYGVSILHLDSLKEYALKLEARAEMQIRTVSCENEISSELIKIE